MDLTQILAIQVCMLKLLSLGAGAFTSWAGVLGDEIDGKLRVPSSKHSGTYHSDT